MAYNYNHNGNGGFGAQYGNGGFDQGYENEGYAQQYGYGGYGQQFEAGAYGQHHHNDFNRQPYGDLGNQQHNGRYAYQTQQLQHATEHPGVFAPTINEQQPGGFGFQARAQAANGRNGTDYTTNVAPNPNAQPFIPRKQAANADPVFPSRQTERQPPPLNAKVLFGDENLPFMRGFAAAALGPAMFGDENIPLPLPHGLSDSERNEREMEAQCMTHTDVAAFWDEENRKLQEQQHQRRQQPHQQTAQPHTPRHTQTPNKIYIDLQNGVGKVRTGKAVYDVVGIIQDRGDQMRMSNGIFLVQHPNGSLRVAKFVKVVTSGQMERARAERDVLLRLKDAHSPHVNFMYECHWPNGDDHAIFILEHCDGGSIEGLIVDRQCQKSMFTEGFMWHFIHHMCSALALCHNGVKNPLKKEHQSKSWSCIAHLDIKPGNVFYSKQGGKGLEDDEYPTIILGDFGCAVTGEDILSGKFPKRGQPFGTMAWYPPEGRTNVGKFAGRYGKSTDIWQLGALVVCMCRLALLPDFDKLYSAQPCGPVYSAELNKMAKWCLEVDVAKRPNAVDIVERMKAWKKVVVEGESGENSGRV